MKYIQQTWDLREEERQLIGELQQIPKSEILCERWHEIEKRLKVINQNLSSNAVILADMLVEWLEVEE